MALTHRPLRLSTYLYRHRQLPYSSLAFETVRAGEDRERVRHGIVIHGLMGAAKNLRPLCTHLLKQVLQQSPPNSPEQLWVLDTIPAKVDIEQTKETERILTTIQSLPHPIPSHRWLLERLMEEGFSRSLAIWIGSNTKRTEPSSQQMTWIFDVEAIYDMLLSYRQTSYWSFLEFPPRGTNIGMVRAENSDRWSPSVILQLEKLAEANWQARKEQGTLDYHVLKNSGHWVHVDNPSGLIDIITPSFLKVASQ